MSLSATANRQLACIMFTDVVGYTKLMGEDEGKAFEILKKNRDIHKPIIERYGGRFIKELGDGMLCTFSSVTDSVLAAADIQTACKADNSYSLRIGLHLSEVVFENNDVFGDGVNIAARIQSIANEGGILISETVQKSLSNKKGIETRLRGHEMLKNVKEGINLYEVLITNEYVVLPMHRKDKEQQTPQTEKSIAVLPFRNLSRDPEQEYFSDGIAEEIIVTLSNIENLKVIGRSTSFQFKGGAIPVMEIGKMLGVATILEGSVRRMGSTVRITAELINIADGRQLWADRYDRELKDIYEIQDDIAGNIAKKLKVQFFEDETKSIPVKMEAYELLLKGRFYVEKYIEGFEKAVACFTRAIEIDPNYGEAYCELARVNFLLTMNLFIKPREGFERAKYYAEKALILNKELGAAHYLLGQINFWFNWDFVKSKREFEIAENCTDSFYFTGVVIDPWYRAFVLGDYETAIKSIQKILETDPLSFYLQFQLGYLYILSKQFEPGREIFNKMLAIVPEFSEAERILAYSYLLDNDNETALLHSRKAAKMAQGMGWAQNLYIITLAKAGYHEEARKELAEWLNLKGPLNISPLGLGIIYSHLGELDKAFEYFNEALEYRDIWAISFKYDPEYDHLRSDPRFQALIDRISYPAN
jgi:adenylate cyclase